MKVHIQSSDPAEIDLFFRLLSKKVAIEETSFEAKGEQHSLFLMDFKELQKCVTIKRKNVTLKQNLEVNPELIANIGLLRASGLSFQKVANKLNDRGFKNSRGNKLNRMQVIRLHKKYESEAKDKL